MNRNTLHAAPHSPKTAFARRHRDAHFPRARRGGTVSVVTGLDAGDLEEIGTALKRHCSTGRHVKKYIVAIQGDHRDKIAAWFAAQGARSYSPEANAASAADASRRSPQMNTRIEPPKREACKRMLRQFARSR